MAIWFVAAWVLAGEAVGGGMFALLVPWPLVHRRRALAGVVAAISTVAAPILIFATLSRAACGCGRAANGYMPPTLFGVVAHGWVVIASAVFPVLMAATTAATLDRLRLLYRA